MKRLVVISILMVVGIMRGYSQRDTSKGIFFEDNLSWQQILEKAQKENKYIFVDCYATWCGPCKLMDKDVYPVDSIGDFMNKNFISVRVQMDTTKHDDARIQEWYGAADTIKGNYHLAGYPSYLFFAPQGAAVHKDMGAKDAKSFLAMAMAGMDPQQQYYTLLVNYRNRKSKNYALMPVLANAARRAGQDSLSEQVAHDYIQHYLETLPGEQLWTRENIMFLSGHRKAISLNDAIFKMYFHDREKIDLAMNKKHFSDNLINDLLYRDMVNPIVDRALNENHEPNWHQLERMVANTFDDFYARNNVIRGQLAYYKVKKMWKNYVKYYIKQQELNGIDSLISSWGNNFTLNNAAYEVFQYSGNKRELEKALDWINRALPMPNDNRSEAEELDTKANLLYKLGRKADGLVLEGKSHSILPFDKDIAANYDKMKSGLPTWVTE